MTNRERADLASAIIKKLGVDNEVENTIGDLPKKPKSFSQKQREVIDYINAEAPQTEIELFISSATQREKAKVVDNIFKDFQQTKDNALINRNKRAVDRTVEKKRDAPSTVDPTASVTLDALKYYYKKQAKAEIAAAAKSDRNKKKVDNDTEKLRSTPGSRVSTRISGRNYDTNNIFTNITNAAEIERGAVDYIWYQRQVKKYTSTIDVRKFVENRERTSAYGGNVSVGQMFSFRYFAKTLSMKVFDKSPMVYVLEDRGDYWLGINFHWIPSKSLRYSIIESLMMGETPDIPDAAYHTYSKESQCLKSPLYHIPQEDMKVAVLLDLQIWHYR